MTEDTYNKNGGPRTKAGRAICSQNALDHGLASERIIMPGENPADFEKLVAAFQQDFDPQTHIEATLVHDLAKFHWLKERAIRLSQQAFFTDKAHDEKFLALMDRYQHSNDRAFHRALKAIQALQKERHKDEKKSVSRPIPEVLYRGLDKQGNIHTTTANPAPKPEASAEPPKKAA